MKIKNRYFMFMFVIRESDVHKMEVYDQLSNRLIAEYRGRSYLQALMALREHLGEAQHHGRLVRGHIFHRGREVLRLRVSLRTETYYVIE